MTQTLPSEHRRETLHVQVLLQSEHWARTQTNFVDVKVETMRTLLKYFMAWIKCVAVAIMKNRNRCDINVKGVFAVNYQITTTDDGQPSKSLHFSNNFLR